MPYTLKLYRGSRGLLVARRKYLNSENRDRVRHIQRSIKSLPMTGNIDLIFFK